MSQEMEQHQEEERESDLISSAFNASDVFSDALAMQVNQQDIESMIDAQKHMYGLKVEFFVTDFVLDRVLEKLCNLRMSRFEKTNEMLINCNALSAVRFHTANHEFKRHTNLLLDMKKDLDTIFKRIRNMKTKLSIQYPQAFRACNENAFEVLDEEILRESEVELLNSNNVAANIEVVVVEPPKEVIAADIQKANVASNYSSSCSQSTSSASPVNSFSTSDSG